MKIALFTDTFYPKVDGIVVSILNFSKELIKNNHKSIVFSPTYKPFKELKMKGISVHRFFSLSLTTYRDVKIVVPNIVKILRLIKKQKPDIIHIHTPGPMGYIGTVCARIFKIPCVGTYHTLVSEQLMYLSLRKFLKIEKAIDSISNSRLIKFFRKRKRGRSPTVFEKDIKKEKFGKRMVWKLSCKIYNNCDMVIAPSEFIKNLLKAKGVRREIIAISNGVDTELFNPKKKYNKAIKRILHVGRISFEKNIDMTIKAFSIVAEKYKDIEYVIIGDGPALNSLKNLSRKLGLNKQIKFLGYVNYNRLPRYYRKSDFFITASPMETQSLVILEALASGLPVIGVNQSAMPDLIKNGFNGFTVEPADTKGMANYAELFIKNFGLIEVLGKNAARSVQSHDLRKTSKLLEEVYKKLIKNKEKTIWKNY